MKSRLYLAVTPDKYELPIAVFDNARQMARWSGRSESSISTAASKRKNLPFKGTSGCKYGYFVVTVEA